MTNQPSRIIDPTVEQIKHALRACAVAPPAGTYPCETCYLYDLRDKYGYMSTGRTCFEHLALDACALIARLNDFEHSQCAKLLEEVGRLRAELERVKAGALITNGDWSNKIVAPHDATPEERTLSAIAFKKCGYSYGGISGIDPSKEV